MFARISAFVIWSLVAGMAVFWALRLFVHAVPAPAYAVATSKSVAMHGDLARLFGAAPVAVAEAQAAQAPSRFKLVGVMAPKAAANPGNYGLALIAVDGKPAKAFAVGAHLDSDLVLQSVGLRTASIGSAGDATSLVLELPALPPPATGVLPPPGSATAVAPANRANASPVPALPGPGNGGLPLSAQAPLLPGPNVAPGSAQIPTSDNLRAQ